MCLRIDFAFHKKGQANKAKADIIVYKNIMIDSNNDCFTPYQDIPIKYNKEGYAFIRGRLKTIASYGELPIKDCVSKGIHGYTNRFSQIWGTKWYLADKGCRIHRNIAIIPRGATYYVGKFGGIVASSMYIFTDSKSYFKFAKKRKNSQKLASDLFHNFDEDKARCLKARH